jgi:hypothetical protein
LQALERHEDSLQRVRLHARAVIPHGEEPVFHLLGRANVDARYGPAAVDQSVAEQILENLHNRSGLPVTAGNSP